VNQGAPHNLSGIDEACAINRAAAHNFIRPVSDSLPNQRTERGTARVPFELHGGTAVIEQGGSSWIETGGLTTELLANADADLLEQL